MTAVLKTSELYSINNRRRCCYSFAFVCSFAYVLLLVCLISTTISVSASVSAESAPQVIAVAAYLPEWRTRSINYDALFTHVTHAIFFSLEVDPKTGLPTAKDRLPNEQVLEEAQVAMRKANAAVASGVADVTPRAKRHAILCFGGNGRSAGFSAMAKNSKKRSKFVKALVKLLVKNKMTGVDYNWEYPGYDMRSGYLSDREVGADYDALAALVRDTREAFDKHNSDAASSNVPRLTEISVAYYPDGRQEKLLVKHGVAEYVNYMHAMAYDAQGPDGHSPMSLAERVVSQANSLFGKEHVGKVTLGLPFYGRDLRMSGWHTYEDIVQKFDPLDDSLDVVNDKKDGTIAFNGRSTIHAKTRLAIESGIGGVMIWEGGQDCRYLEVSRKKHVSSEETEVHKVTCPRGKESSLMGALSDAIHTTKGKLKLEKRHTKTVRDGEL